MVGEHGLVGRPYGVGSRMKLTYTRAIIDAIHSGAGLGADRHRSNLRFRLANALPRRAGCDAATGEDLVRPGGVSPGRQKARRLVPGGFRQVRRQSERRDSVGGAEIASLEFSLLAPAAFNPGPTATARLRDVRCRRWIRGKQSPGGTTYPAREVVDYYALSEQRCNAARSAKIWQFLRRLREFSEG